MRLRPLLFLCAALCGTACFAQKRRLDDSLRCTQYLDTVANRMLYRFPEKDVRFKGGQEGLVNYLRRRLDVESSKVTLTTTLTYNIVVEPDGSISHVSLRSATRGADPRIVENGLRVVRGMSRPKPAECGGQKVAVLKTVSLTLVPPPPPGF